MCPPHQHLLAGGGDAPWAQLLTVLGATPGVATRPAPRRPLPDSWRGSCMERLRGPPRPPRALPPRLSGPDYAPVTDLRAPVSCHPSESRLSSHPRPLPQTCRSRWRVASPELRPGAVRPAGPLSPTAHSDLPAILRSSRCFWNTVFPGPSPTFRWSLQPPVPSGPHGLHSRPPALLSFPARAAAAPPPAHLFQNAPLGATPCLSATALLTPSSLRPSPTSVAPFVSKILIQRSTGRPQLLCPEEGLGPLRPHQLRP